MNRIKIIITALLLALFAQTSSYADTKPLITIACIENYRPYSYSENNRPEGLYNDIIRELFKRAGYPVKIDLMPFKRILLMSERGGVTGMAGVFITPEREQFSTFINDFPLAEITIHIFVLKESSIKTPTLKDLKGKTIGNKRGFVMSLELDIAAKNNLFQLEEAETVEQLIKMLMLKRIDAFCYPKNNALYYITKLNQQNKIKILDPPITDSRNSYIAFSNKSLKNLPTTFLADIQTALNSMKDDDTLKTINLKYNLAMPTTQ